VLGDNIFYGYLDFLRKALSHPSPAVIFGYYVTDPGRYGVIEFDEYGVALSIEEKPSSPRSHYAVPGLYVYDASVIEMARSLEPSGRGELEITDVNRHFLEKGELHVIRLGRGMAWLDTGTHQSLLDAANFIATIEARQGLKIGCIEEAAFRMGCIDLDGFLALVEASPDCPYRAYLERIAEEFDGDRS
jgi:glucose-1-phosphate thymidylyltransferase